MKKQNYSIYSEWNELVDDWKNSGLSKKAWCRLNNRTPQQLRYWLKKFDSEPVIQQPLQWVSADMLTKGCNQETQIVNDTITIRINNISIDVKKGFDSTLLSEIVRTLS